MMRWHKTALGKPRVNTKVLVCYENGKERSYALLTLDNIGQWRDVPPGANSHIFIEPPWWIYITPPTFGKKPRVL